MGEQRNILGKQYQDLYDNYYSDPKETQAKRRISAGQSVDCMRSALAGRSFQKLLDVGAGDGNVLVELNNAGIAKELYAVEISASGVAAIAAKSFPLVRDVRLFDGYQIPFGDKFFDVAIAVHVLEHVEHERLFLREMGRVAKSLFIEVPLEHGLKVQRSINSGKKFGHINFYTIETLRSMLESTGLRVVKSGIIPSSLKYEQHLSGATMGWIKNRVRRTALAVAPRLAPWFIVYNGYAYCECN